MNPEESGQIDFDVERLRSVRLRRKKTPPELSRAAGLERHFVGLLEAGVRERANIPVRKLGQLAKASGIPPHAFLRDGRRVWEEVWWWEVNVLKEYLREMSDSRSLICFSQGVDSYLLPDEMVAWSETVRLAELGWSAEDINARLEQWGKYVADQRAARDKGKFVHRIIGPEGFFLGAFRHQNDWVSDVKKTLGDLDGLAVVGLVSAANWPAVNRIVAAVTGFSSCDKICVADDLLALIRPSPHVFLFTYDHATVLRLRNGLERLIPLVPYDFPALNDSTADFLRESVRRAKHALEQVARRTLVARRPGFRVQMHSKYTG